MTSSLSRLKNQILMLALCAAVSPFAHATIVFSSDTGTELRGSWTALGPTPLESLSATTFGSFLPNGDDRIGLRVDSSIAYGTFGPGSPDNPFQSIAIPASDTAIPSYSGSFNNNSSTTSVFFLFSDLQYTVRTQTFNGNFCFSTDKTECVEARVPAPATLALLGMGLAGLAASRRRKH